jgi:photosystem II stability/assembly factor-like uncharacterized protein
MIVTCVSDAQNTDPYSEIPGYISAYKPGKTSTTPAWALPLYDYPIHPEYVAQLLQDQNFEGQLALRRYCKQFLRQVAPFLNENGEVDHSAIHSYASGIQRAQSKHRSTLELSPTWDFLGPKETYWLNESNSPNAPSSCPWQVNVYSIDVAYTNPNILYAGTETGYVNKTVDKGLSWEFVGRDYPFGGGVTAVAIHPNDENRVFVAAGRQIHETKDGGESWATILPTNNRFQSRRIEIKASSPNRLIASSDRGVFISDDLGLTWRQAWAEQCWDAHALPGMPQTIVALTESNGKFQLIFSQDGGNTFQASKTFPDDITQSSGGLISVTPDAPDMIHVVMLSEGNTPYLFEGNGPEGNWLLLAQGRTAALEMDNGQGYFDLVLETSPFDHNLIYVGTTSLFLSRNKGQTFERIGGYGGAFPIHPDIQDLKIVSETDTWVATDGGLTLTTDQFTTLENSNARINGLVGSDMWGFDQGWNEDIIVGGRYHNGNTAIADFYQPKALRMGGAESPTGWILKGKSRHAAFNDLGNGWILPESAESAPEGRFIFSKYPNMDEYGGRRGNIITHPNYYGHLLLGEGSGLWSSTDLGETYELIHDFGSRVRFIQQSYSDPKVVYADVVNVGFHRSDDGGHTWTHLPALTDGSSGTGYWRGKTHFVISPTNADRVYACLSNGTWSNDIGKVLKSEDGGQSWTDITGSLDAYTKSLAIQVDKDGRDLLYLACNTHQDASAKVYYLLPGANEWEELGVDFPAGFDFNLILPFYRDGLIRAAGNGGVWSHDMIEKDGMVIPQPFVQKENINCFLDTLYFNDHSMVNHEGTSWNWTFDPDPSYVSDHQVRNPKVVLGSPGSYDVTLTITKGGIEHKQTLESMVTATTCPSVNDCSNPDLIDKSEWELLYFNSEEVNFPGRAQMAMDGDPETIWHTRWSTGTDPHPHELQWDLGRNYDIKKMKYLPRQVGVNGRIKEYEVYVSDVEGVWEEPTATGSFENSSAPQWVDLPSNTIGRYVRLVSLSEVNDGPWTSIAELDILGCIPITTKSMDTPGSSISGFPVPSDGLFTIPLQGGMVQSLQLIYTDGKSIPYDLKQNKENILVDLSGLSPGIYWIRIESTRGVFFVKAIKI